MKSDAQYPQGWHTMDPLPDDTWTKAALEAPTSDPEPRSAPAWMQMHSGLPFDVVPVDGHWANVRLADIAHALSLQCRFAGHTLRHYSVAEHSVLVAVRVWELVEGLEIRDQVRVTKGALLHDASEYVLVDIPSPWKYTGIFSQYREKEALIQASIALQYGYSLSDCEKSIIHQADVEILAVEKRDVMGPSLRAWPSMPDPPSGYRAGLWTSLQAKEAFLELAHCLGLADPT